MISCDDQLVPQSQRPQYLGQELNRSPGGRQPVAKHCAVTQSGSQTDWIRFTKICSLIPPPNIHLGYKPLFSSNATGKLRISISNCDNKCSEMGLSLNQLTTTYEKIKQKEEFDLKKIQSHIWKIYKYSFGPITAHTLDRPSVKLMCTATLEEPTGTKVLNLSHSSTCGEH